jgi:hypothetical protein
MNLTNRDIKRIKEAMEILDKLVPETLDYLHKDVWYELVHASAKLWVVVKHVEEQEES